MVVIHLFHIGGRKGACPGPRRAAPTAVRPGLTPSASA